MISCKRNSIISPDMGNLIIISGKRSSSDGQ